MSSVLSWMPIKEYPPLPGAFVYVCGRMRYEWESEWTYFVDIARVDFDNNMCLWNDWHEGQQYYEVKYWKPVYIPDPVLEGEW